MLLCLLSFIQLLSVYKGTHLSLVTLINLTGFLLYQTMGFVCMFHQNGILVVGFLESLFLDECCSKVFATGSELELALELL